MTVQNRSEVPESLTEGGRAREIHLRSLPFASYRPRAPEPRRPTGGGNKLGLQIRYYWGDALLQVSQYERISGVYVGATDRCDLRLDAAQLGMTEHALVQELGGAFMVSVGPGMTGGLDRDGSRSAWAEGIYELRSNDFAWVEMKGVRAELNFTDQPARARVPWSQSIDYHFVNLFLLLTVAAGFLGIAGATRTEVDVVADDLSPERLSRVRFLLDPPQRPPRAPSTTLSKLETNAQPAEPAGRHRGPEGQMGSRTAPNNPNRRTGTKGLEIDAKALASNTSLLATIGSGGGGLSKIFGERGFGGDVQAALGALVGTEVGDAGGFGGLGLRGSGPGGGGVGETVGIGVIGTVGQGRKFGGYGTRVGQLQRKEHFDPIATDSVEEIQGSLGRDLIRNVIRLNIGQIRFCYEQELQLKPRLEGKVAVRFVIAANGEVQSARIADGTTLHDERVTECIASRVRSWRFPSPKGGGKVIVTYPFLLRPAGD